MTPWGLWNQQPDITRYYLVGGLEHFLFSHILGIIIPIDFHIFQRGGPTTNQLYVTLRVEEFFEKIRYVQNQVLDRSSHWIQSPTSARTKGQPKHGICWLKPNHPVAILSNWQLEILELNWGSFFLIKIIEVKSETFQLKKSTLLGVAKKKTTESYLIHRFLSGYLGFAGFSTYCWMIATYFQHCCRHQGSYPVCAANSSSTWDGFWTAHGTMSRARMTGQEKWVRDRQ